MLCTLLPKESRNTTVKMEEAVALDSKKQKKFVKSIKGLKKLIKQNKEGNVFKPQVLAPKKDGKIEKKKRHIRGLVYVSHIPHGFYEHEMTEYFKQFGVVTNVRVIKSRRTGRSKGCAFVEFKDTAVADIVSETMNNYLMGKRIIKAVAIPPAEQRKAFRKNWTPQNNPTAEITSKFKKNFNADKSDEENLKKARSLLSNLRKVKRKLISMGIDYTILPVDVPEQLKESIKSLQEEVQDVKDTKDQKEVKDEKASKEEKKLKKEKEMKKEVTTNQGKETKKVKNGQGKEVKNDQRTQMKTLKKLEKPIKKEKGDIKVNKVKKLSKSKKEKQLKTLLKQKKISVK